MNSVEIAEENQNEEQTTHLESSAHAIESPRETPDDWVIAVTDKIEQAFDYNFRTFRNDICIYKVPHYLLEKDEKSYFPQTVSIGPYHYGKEHLQFMEIHKWRAVAMVVRRLDTEIRIYINAMKELEEDARACYEGPIDLNSNKFLEMLVVDGCFVLELLAGAYDGFSNLGYAPNDPVFAIRGLMHSIRRDMLMLENQLPFFVLHRLAELQNRRPVVKRLSAHFFYRLMPTSGSFMDSNHYKGFTRDLWQSEEGVDELHCLNVFRHCLLEGKLQPSQSIRERASLPLVADKGRQRMIPCVMKLKDAGFKFRRRETNRFWDIQFHEGYLEIPQLQIHDGTKSLFLNLIAFEQSYIYSSNDITSYMIFMDNLIDSAEDVHYLRRCNVIDHSLGSDSEVANMFSGLCHEVVFSTNDVYLSQLLEEVARCYKHKYFRKWNAWKRALKHKYFDNPWAYLSFSAAVLLLFLTFSQTYFAANAYFKTGS